jgi:hypothetical protein
MYLGNRNIRSAGRTSGSVEITLPVQLHVLEGVECRMTVRDGSRPEIVLQPDLSASQLLFQALWERLRLGLGEIDEIGDFSAGDFALALFVPPHWQVRPPLAYIDGLDVLRWRAGQSGRGPEALTRLLASLAVAAGYRLGLKGVLALAFGDAVAYIITGAPAGLGTDFERGMAHRLFWGDGHAQDSLGCPFDNEVWRKARPGFRRVCEQFDAWQATPERCTAAREKWYRALSVDIGMQITPVGSRLVRRSLPPCEDRGLPLAIEDVVLEGHNGNS